MESSRRAPSTASVLAILVVAIVAFSGATAVLYPQPTSPSTGASYAGLGTTTEAISSSLGLKLTLTVNSSTIPSQDVIAITASALNTLPTANNLTASDSWAIGGLRSGPCDLGDSTDMLFSPVGLGIFRGTYGLNNISGAGSPLPVWAAIECPADYAFAGNQSYPLSNITSYSLRAGSDNGAYAGYYAVSYAPETLSKGAFSTQMADQASIYAANGTGFYNSLGSSLPASYTLVAGDEWGQLTLLHFSVVASSILPKVGSFLANGEGGSCAAGGNPVPCETSYLSQAFIFDCAAQAATASGCTTQVPSPFGASYTITVRYPYVGQPGEPSGDNCKYSVPGDTASPYAHCFMVNATAFAVSLVPS